MLADTVWASSIALAALSTLCVWARLDAELRDAIDQRDAQQRRADELEADYLRVVGRLTDPWPKAAQEDHP